MSTRVSEFKARLDINPRLPNKEWLKIVDALNEIGNVPIEALNKSKIGLDQIDQSKKHSTSLMSVIGRPP